MGKTEFNAERYPLDEYINVDNEVIAFPEDIYIAFAVCSKECGNTEFIVDGSSQICQYCGKMMFRTYVKKYIISEK